MTATLKISYNQENNVGDRTMRNQRFIILFFIFLSLPLKAQTSSNDVELSVWANEAIVATYTYNYQNFLMRQKEIAKYFTANGWIAYSKALNDSNIPEVIKENNYYISAVATLPPEIKGIGANKWEATLPLLVMYKNPQYRQTQTLKVVINFMRVPAGQGIRGLAITSLKATSVTPACKCENKNDATNETPPEAAPKPPK